MQQENFIMFQRFQTALTAGRGLSNAKLIEWYYWVHEKIDKYARGASALVSGGRRQVEMVRALSILLAGDF
jgi:hypothetical protein